jgi:hypothetical protein
MLSDTPFYYKMLRKYVIIMGNMFNNISILRMNPNGTERERFKVPITFSPKERWVSRLSGDPDFSRTFQNVLPRMGFDINGFEYDSARKQNQLLRMAKGDNASRVASGFMGVPYDINFELNIYARNIDDGAQIVEQILPYFNPDYTVSINPIQELGFLKDIPIILTGVNQTIQYEGTSDDVRYVNWSLGFVVKGYFYGPISKPKIIRKSIANIFNDPSLVAGNVVRMNLNTGNNGSFKIGDIVYQGLTYQTATAFKLTNTIRGLSTNASYTLESFDVSPLKLVKITVEPDPIDAEPEEDFGFTTSIQEFPNITETP